MERKSFKRLSVALGIFAGVWIAARYLLPVGMPFLLGTMVALAAEPGVRFLVQKMNIRRGMASFVVISMGFAMFFVMIWVLGAFLYRELTLVAAGLPGVFRGVSEGVEHIRTWAVELAARAPEGLRSPLSRFVGDLFAGSSVFLEKAASAVFTMAGSVMGGLPGGAMLVGTAVISSFMISAQLPSLRRKIRRRINKERLQNWLMAFSRVKGVVLAWLKAQLKLSGVTFCIVGLGFLILRVKSPLFGAAVVALVDAVPLLGTGTILIPWAVLSLLRGEGIRAVGLMGLYVTAMLVRSALEPKLLGRHLGINPLLTLAAIYAGYRIWGVGGMILAPILTVTARQLADLRD